MNYFFLNKIKNYLCKNNFIKTYYYASTKEKRNYHRRSCRHNFNTYFRDNEVYNVVAFTAAQIPDIDGRKYPSELAGKLYPQGILIYAESEVEKLIKDLKVDICVFSYSDVTYHKVMGISAIVNAGGADFKLLGPSKTQIKSTKPVISVCAVRTGCGKAKPRAK